MVNGSLNHSAFPLLFLSGSFTGLIRLLQGLGDDICSIPLAEWHPRPPQHILYLLCQTALPSNLSFSSAAIPFTHLGAGENCPGSKETAYTIMLLHRVLKSWFYDARNSALCSLLSVSPSFLLVALYKIHRRFAKK